ncbi:hypothetical protein ACFLU5_12345, partial [Bacteroidota bacterium]
MRKYFHYTATALFTIGFLVLSFISEGNYLSTRTREKSDRIVIRDNFSNIELKYDGELQLSDDDTDIIGIAPGGYFRISKTSFGNKRSILIESDGDGNLTKKYFEGRTELSYNPSGREWLADVLPEIVRASDLAAEQRVHRIYSKLGTDGVIQEIREIDSDYISAIYYNHLLGLEELNSQELQKIARSVGSDLDSDFESAKVLVKNYNVFKDDPIASTAYFGALMDMDSDFERAKVITNVSEESIFTHENIVQITQVLLDMDSDFEISKSIKAISENQTLNEGSLNALLEVVIDMDSDFERSKSVKFLTTDQ